MKKFVPIWSVCKDSSGKTWYNPHCDILTLDHRWSQDLEIVLRTDKDINLTYHLSKAHLSSLATSLWKPFLSNPSLILTPADILDGFIVTWQDCWIKKNECIPANVSATYVEDNLFENKAHAYAAYFKRKK